MIINNNAVKLESNAEPSKALNFGISDVRLVVDILSKLYAHPIQTLVQEYICNGRDAMREAYTWGKLPIEITVPTTLEPVFKVRDYGIGISADRMENIFVNYGSSTKRNTNAQTGGFGIGAKSAFSYTDSFTITSFVAGTKYIYVAHLADDGGVNLIGQEKTTERNGVEISIGVKSKDIVEFYNAVQRCVKFWTEPIKFFGTKNIFQLKPTLTLGNMSVYEEAHPARTIFLIDGIEYDLMTEETNNYYRLRSSYENNLHSDRHTVAINVPNGHFKIASSRERLENNDANKAKQTAMLNTCKDLIDQVLKSKINTSSLSLSEKIKNKQTYSGFDSIKRERIQLGGGHELANDTVYLPKAIYYRYCRRGRRGTYHFETDNRTNLAVNTMIYSSTETDNTLARKLNHYLESNKDCTLVRDTDISVVPNHDIIFTERINADTLPLPPKKTAQRTKKSTVTSICWKIEIGGSKVQWSIEMLNQTAFPVVLVDEVTPEAKEIANFMTVINVPKCNKDLVLKKGMTIEQGKNYLLSKNKEDVVGLDCLPHGWEKVNVLKKFKRKKSADAIQRYLLDTFPMLKAEHDLMKKEYVELVKKYPLITVLGSLGYYSNNSSQIVIDEINKQSKEK
jgi:hypothetical protein